MEPLLNTYIKDFLNDNFDKRDRNKQDTYKFELFLNSIHILSNASHIFNLNSKIGKIISLGKSEGIDAFFISTNNYKNVYTLEDSTL